MSRKFYFSVIGFVFSLFFALTSCSTTESTKKTRPPAFSLENRSRYTSLDNKSIHFTVSGISSGAFMAHQLQVAYSDIVEGAASFAGGTYNCSMGQTLRAQGLCMKTPELLNLNKIYKNITSLESQKSISSTKNLKSKKILLFHGSKDLVIRPASSNKLADFYKNYGAEVIWSPTIAAGHGFPSDRGINECHETKLPWLNKCSTLNNESFDGAGWALQGLYPDLMPKTYSTNDHIFRVDQKATRLEKSWMSDSGHAYIPQICLNTPESCRYHVALHGCLQGPDKVGLQFVTQAGYNEWAESNKMVIYYPAVQTDLIHNPAGCWDWWGYSGTDFANKNSTQMRSILITLNQIKQSLASPEEDPFLLPLAMVQDEIQAQPTPTENQ